MHLFTWTDVNRIVVRSGLDIYNDDHEQVATSIVGFISYLIDKYKSKKLTYLDKVRAALEPLESIIDNAGFPGRAVTDIGFYISARLSGYTDEELREEGYGISVDTFIDLLSGGKLDTTKLPNGKEVEEIEDKQEPVIGIPDYL